VNRGVSTTSIRFYILDRYNMVTTYSHIKLPFVCPCGNEVETAEQQSKKHEGFCVACASGIKPEETS